MTPAETANAARAGELCAATLLEPATETAAELAADVLRCAWCEQNSAHMLLAVAADRRMRRALRSRGW